MYAKIENGKIVQPPSMLKDVERTFYDDDGKPFTGHYLVGYDPNVEPIPEVVTYLLNLGYLPVTTSVKPEDGDGYHYIAGYELQHDDSVDEFYILQIWERVDDEPEPPTLEDDLYHVFGGI